MARQSINTEMGQPPYSLKTTQEWFASVITQQLNDDQSIQSHSPHGYLIAEEASQYINPSSTLKSHERIQIYNQQYWWRLFNALHLNFPFVTRLFGHHAFNEEIATPYLQAYPPHHWSLNELGDALPEWIDKHYRAPDKTLIYHAAKLDCAFIKSFLAPKSPPLDLSIFHAQKPENLLQTTIYLHSHIHLFEWAYDLLSFRARFLEQSVEYWIEHPFPELPKDKNYLFVLYRNSKNHVVWREISRGELTLLKLFKRGISLQAASDYLDDQSASLREEILPNLESWFQQWAQSNWFTLESQEDLGTEHT